MKNLILLMSLFSLIAYNKKDPQVCCTGPVKASVLNVTMPASIALGNSATLAIKYALNNGCTEFNRLNKTTIADTTFINMEAFSCGCVCTDIFRSPTFNYTFAPNQVGVYIFKFAAANNTVIEKRITVL